MCNTILFTFWRHMKNANKKTCFIGHRNIIADENITKTAENFMQYNKSISKENLTA